MRANERNGAMHKRLTGKEREREHSDERNKRRKKEEKETRLLAVKGLLEKWNDVGQSRLIATI